MATKTDFTADEWKTILASPMLAGMASDARGTQWHLGDDEGGVNGCQNPRKDGGAKIIGMTFATGSAAPRRRTLGGKRRPGGKPCQRRQPPQAGAEGPG